MADPAVGSNAFRKLIGSGDFAPVPLGKVGGVHQLWLIPGLGSLPTTGPSHINTYSYVSTNCSAISYPDGHPSEGELITGVGCCDGEEEKLRRFVSIGWVVTGTRDDYGKTGHSLVIDVQNNRQLNPWIVLASEFPNDSGDLDYNGDDTVYVAQVVTRDDPEKECGVLPGDVNRTPHEGEFSQCVQAARR